MSSRRNIHTAGTQVVDRQRNNNFNRDSFFKEQDKNDNNQIPVLKRQLLVYQIFTEYLLQASYHAVTGTTSGLISDRELFLLINIANLMVHD